MTSSNARIMSESKIGSDHLKIRKRLHFTKSHQIFVELEKDFNLLLAKDKPDRGDSSLGRWQERSTPV